MKERIVTIHQPEHLPWLGFFHKMALADVYVVLDTVQFEKNYFQNRNRLVDKEGNIFWLTVPVLLKGFLEGSICDIPIDNAQPWRRKYWGRLSDCYGKHPFFSEYESELKTVIQAPFEKLVDLNLGLIEFFRKTLGYQNDFLRASTLGVEGKSTDLLVGVAKAVEATRYLSGPSGKDYLEREKFCKAEIELDFHEFSHPEYPAKYSHKGLSALDLLLNHGADSMKEFLGIASERGLQKGYSSARRSDEKNLPGTL